METKKVTQFSDQTVQQGYLRNLSATHWQPRELEDFFSLGRGSQNHWEICDPWVSDRHARIEKKGKSFNLRDLNSRNGTFVNGTRVIEAKLKDGDQITLGQTRLVFTESRQAKKTKFCLTSRSPKWQRQLSRLNNISLSEMPVLIQGSSGSGKEILAQSIHNQSQRSYGPLINVNSSALSESLIESELFGHVKGSFTGATENRKGAFEAARGGTLFLDEIGDLPLSLQPKLLRALENNEIKPVGADKPIKTNVRIIAATHKNLGHQIQQNLFREDLFFRLNIVELTIPDLKDRMEDFEDLLYYFCEQYKVRFSFAAIQEMKTHKWPGNIRELKNLVARAKALYGQTAIDKEMLGDVQLKDINSKPPLPADLPTIKELELHLIEQSLKASGGNQRKAAMFLGMPKSTLHDRIRDYGINISDFKR